MDHSGRIFVAFYRLSRAQEDFLARTGLLRNNVLFNRQCLEIYLLKPIQALAWVAERAGAGYFRAATWLFRVCAFSTLQEKIQSSKMQRMFARMDNPRSLINAAPEKVPYRNEAEIANLFKRLAIPVKQLDAFGSCFMVQLE